MYDDGSLLVRLDSREVSVDGAPIALTPTEYRLLVALIKHPGQTLAPEQLLELAWNDPLGIGPERVKFGVMRLRRKLGPGRGHRGGARLRLPVRAPARFRPRDQTARSDRAIRGTATHLHRSRNCGQCRLGA